MDRLDDQKINLYFGRSHEGLDALKVAVDEAITLLKRLFCDWVATFEVEPLNSGYTFSENCFVINFNYTDTVEKRFHISQDHIFHIHGTATQPESIVVGHTTHPEEPFRELIEHHFIRPLIPGRGLPRFEGLYTIEEALYKTDKHTVDIIDQLCVKLMECGAHIEDFEHIYVLGHSFAETDIEYFRFIDLVTRCCCNYDAISPAAQIDVELMAAITASGELGEDILMQMISWNIEYACHHRNRLIENAEDFFPELQPVDQLMGGHTYQEEKAKYAVRQRFLFEQAQRTHKLLQAIADKSMIHLPSGCKSVLGLMDYIDMEHDPRKKNAIWHISYFSDEDRKRIDHVMKQLHVKRSRYQLCDSIDKCIATFKKNTISRD